MKKLRIMEIDWIDSTTIDVWSDELDHSDAEHIIKTVGYFITDVGDYIVLVQNIDPENGDMSMSMRIPKGCVKKKRFIR